MEERGCCGGEVSRKNFLGLVAGGIVGLIGAVLGGAGLTYFVSPAFKKESEGWVNIGPADAVKPGVPVKIDYVQRKRDAWATTEQRSSAWVLTSDGKDFTVFDPRCTHLGCPYRWDQSQELFLCPCHAGVFNKEGKVMAGPPPRPLDRYVAKVESGRLLHLAASPQGGRVSKAACALRDWIFERTGADKLWEALFARHVPEGKGWVTWLYTLGSASLFVFSVQAVTGALLAMNYVPSPDHAYDSVKYISDSVLLGHFIRGLHHWGASFMVVLVVLHMLRVFFMGAYKYPREGTWIVGVALLLVVIGFGFTGYLLPWDQKAYWATMVGTNIAGQTPVLGPYLSKILKGGPEMGAATMTRFYALHVLVLPGIILALILAHLFLVVWHGISEPPSRAVDAELGKEPRA